MKSLYTQLLASPVEAIGKLYKLERKSRYEEALEILQEIWKDISTMPDVENFETRTAAEILLRCGAIIGFFGHIKQIPGTQENSKNILTEARTRFLSIYDSEKITECENYLALAYWRTGELNEAEAWIDEALSRKLPDSSKTKLYSLVNQSLFRLAAGEYSEIIADFKKYETIFRKFGDALLNGSFHTNCSIALKNEGNNQEALEKLELARFYHQKSQHEIHLGIVENNLAQLYKNEKRFDKAHKTIDSAAQIFKKIGDRMREGFSLDTKAQIYFEEQNFAKGLEIAEKAVSILKKGENQAYLVEALMTKVKTLLFLDDFPAAVFCLTDAVQIARVQISDDAAKKLAEDFERSMNEKSEYAEQQEIARQKASEKSAEEVIDLILPPSLAHYKSVQGVWLNNNHLENIGLRQGLLAIVAETEIKRGDLAAIVEKETNSVICGYYDADFGIVCIEKPDVEPQLFDENEIEVLGKIVGFSNPRNGDDSGKIMIEAIQF